MRLKIFSLTELDLTSMYSVKELICWYGNQDHLRWILKDGNFFYKIWNPTSIRKNNLLKALDVDFYDENLIPAFVGLIFHKQECRGYVMKKGRQNKKLNPEIYDLLKNKTKRTNYFTYQFSPFHTIKLKKKYSLIDLEGVYHLSDLKKLKYYHCEFSFLDYKSFVYYLYNSKYHPILIQANNTYMFKENNKNMMFNFINRFFMKLERLNQLIFPKIFRNLDKIII